MQSWVFAAVGVSFAVTAACSSSSGSSDSGAGSGGAGGSGTSSSIANSSSSSQSSSSATTAATGSGGGATCDAAAGTNCASCPQADTSSACADNPKNCTDCETCCQHAQPAATKALVNDLTTACQCTEGAICYTQCTDPAANICMDASTLPTQACLDCLNGAIMANDGCLTTAIQLCQSDATCQPIIQCFTTCPSM